jgi:O-antigen/teichoic acid export membrane protein
VSLRDKLLSRSSVIFASRLGGAGVIFLTQAAMARLWGPELLGQYLVVIAAVNIVAVVMPLGFESIGTYFAAEYRAQGRGRALRRFMVRAYGHIAVTGLLLFAFGKLALPLVGSSAAVIERHWLAAVVMTVATAMVYCNSALLVGLKRPFAGFFGDTVFRPFLVAAGFALSLLAGGAEAGLDALLGILAGGFAVIAVAQLVWLARAASDVPAESYVARSEVRRWWRFALPWVVIALATDFFFDIDMLLLANLMPHADLAVFGVATRVFSIIAFGVSAVYAVILPDMFAANAGTNRSALSQQIGDANLAASAVALGLLGAVLLGGPLVLLLFGPHFAQGLLPLAILCLSLLVRAGFGPAALVLSLHDRPYATLPTIALGLGMLICCNLLLVPAYGLVGAAIAALVAQTFWAAAMWLTARLLAGIDVSVVPRIAGLIGERAGRKREV